ncbi:MAG: hypothetical protein K2O28_04320 [Clostridia bacterium]|nr:hypothetical protein [Clostridia bacterium]
MKFKKALAVGFAALLVVGLTACKGGEEENGNSGVASDYNFEVNGSKVTLRWDKYDGATGYSIEKSSSRYGVYDYLDYVDGGVNEYVANDINAYYKITTYTESGDIVTVGIYSQETALFGKNTYIYSPDDDPEKIKEELDAFYHKTDGTKEGAQKRARGEFTEDRLAAFFKAGEYDININMGYYTALAGLGASPDDVTITNVSTDAPISLCNFWRTAENLTVNSDMRWAVSQATSLRRVHVKGDLNLSSIVGDGGNDSSTSGGFIADTKVDGRVNSGSQQQWLSRNSSFGGWQGCVWNSAFVGVEGTLPADNWAGLNQNYTNIENSGAIREKPYLTYDETNGYRVFVPNTDSTRGTSWDGAGEYLSLDKFYVARSDRDTAATINAELAKGKNLILTAGVYELEAPLKVEHGGAVVLGLGLATLRPTDDNTDTLLRIADTENISVGGLLFDAGKNTKTLLEVGEENSNNHFEAPAVLSDLFFRVGGAKEVNTSVEACVVINSNHVVGDNFWIWRADHWDGVGWDKNKADTGIIVNGDGVTFYGLFVEHFQKYQTVWNGNGGTTYFYQSELPYDVPDKASWSPDGTVNGYASYYVAEGVTTHTAHSLGVYSYLRDASVTLDSAIVCPQTSGMDFNHMVTVWLTGKPASAITHIINGEGEAAVSGATVQVLAKYTPQINK